MRKTKIIKKKPNYPNCSKKGNPEISKCLDKSLLLIKQLEITYGNSETYFTDNLATYIQELLESIDNFHSRKQLKNNFSVLHTRNDDGEIISKVFSTKYQSLTVTNDDLQYLVRLMQYFKIEENEGCEHFLLIKERRQIDTNIYYAFLENENTSKKTAEMHDNWIPEKFLYDTAKESMRWGDAEWEIKKGVKITSSQNLSYIIKPYSNFGNRLISRNSLPINIKKDYYQISPFDNLKWYSIIDLMQSLFVQYYVITGGFYSVQICDECNCLFLRKQDSDTNIAKKSLTAITCSSTCYKAIWKRKNPLESLREDCFNNHREWLKDKLYTDSIKETSRYCIDCPIDLRSKKFSRGECPFLCKKYGVKIENEFHKMTRRSYQADICRQRQNNWFQNHINKNIFRRAKDCDNCPIENNLYPHAGFCPILRKKYNSQLNKINR